MNHWLLKTEPSAYSFADLLRDKETTWDGVANPTALIHLRAMKKGDLAFIYHTGDERAAVGIAKLSSDPFPDPKADNEKFVAIKLKPVSTLKRPVTLAELKADPAFAGWDLLRLGRLSVVPTPAPLWDRILKLASP